MPQITRAHLVQTRLPREVEQAEKTPEEDSGPNISRHASNLHRALVRCLARPHDGCVVVADPVHVAATREKATH